MAVAVVARVKVKISNKIKVRTKQMVEDGIRVRIKNRVVGRLCGLILG